MNGHGEGPNFLELKDGGSLTIVYSHYICLLIVYSIISTYLLVFGDDRVTRYTRADDVSDEVGDT